MGQNDHLIFLQNNIKKVAGIVPNIVPNIVPIEQKKQIAQKKFRQKV